jgi:hypothetical protein
MGKGETIEARQQELCLVLLKSCCSPGEGVLAAASMSEAPKSVILPCFLRLRPLSNLGKYLNRSLVILRYCDVYPIHYL